MGNELLNVKEAAAYLRLNFMTVYKLAKKGSIPSSRIGTNWRFRKEALDDWMMRKSAVRKLSTLIVDDEATASESLEATVIREGHAVTTASTLKASFRAISRQDFDLIFFGLRMPDVVGVDTLRTVKEKAADGATIIVTGYADYPGALAAMEFGPLLLMRKPFQEAHVVEALNMVARVRTSSPLS